MYNVHFITNVKINGTTLSQTMETKRVCLESNQPDLFSNKVNSDLRS